MTAQGQFHKGQRVRLSPRAVELDIHLYSGRGRKNRVQEGVVTGFGRDGTCIRVKPDGAKTVQLFSAVFWEPIPEGADHAEA